MARVYLETSFVSACVTNRDDAASIYRRDVSLEWWQKIRHHYDLFQSAEVTRELSHPANPNRDAAIAMLVDVPLLELSDEVVGLAQLLVRERVMPAKPGGDALHVAAATYHGMDFLLSWNVKHLANRNKLEHLRVVCLRTGFAPPLIVTPDYLWEDT